MKMKDLVIEFSETFKAEDVADLLTSALEGGSNYWYRIKAHNRVKLELKYVSEVPLHPDGFIIFTSEMDSTGHKLDRNSIIKGIKTFKDKFPRHYSDWKMETGDASTGDVFLQCCLFDDVLYG